VNERSIKISIIIPAREAGKVMPVCLQAIRNSVDLPHEVIVVDDHSTDSTADIGRRSGAKVLRNVGQAGPAAARNVGARNSSGDVLLFIDSDVAIRPDTLTRVSWHFQADNCVAAAFGSYDDEPAEPDFISQYKNLQHHFVHQTAKTEAATFWAGCGAVRREVFFEIGGFDEVKYSKPSIEDIEFGYRLRAKGYRVVLDRDLCVKHLKKWTLQSHIRTEIFNRAIPWSKLILENGKMIRDLNLTMSHRVSAGLVFLLILSLPLLAFHYLFAGLMILSLLGILVLNRRLYGFFWKHRGLGFASKSVLLHLLHYTYSGAALVLCWTIHFLTRLRSRIAVV
jgi:glycosyltransferase involved in cell wall biosynthesis